MAWKPTAGFKARRRRENPVRARLSDKPPWSRGLGWFLFPLLYIVAAVSVSIWNADVPQDLNSESIQVGLAMLALSLPWSYFGMMVPAAAEQFDQVAHISMAINAVLLTAGATLLVRARRNQTAA